MLLLLLYQLHFYTPLDETHSSHFVFVRYLFMFHLARCHSRVFILSRHNRLRVLSSFLCLNKFRFQFRICELDRSHSGRAEVILWLVCKRIFKIIALSDRINHRAIDKIYLFYHLKHIKVIRLHELELLHQVVLVAFKRISKNAFVHSLKPLRRISYTLAAQSPFMYF